MVFSPCLIAIFFFLDVIVSPNKNDKKPKDLAEEIKEKSFGMEPERLQSVSTDGQYLLSFVHSFCHRYDNNKGQIL